MATLQSIELAGFKSFAKRTKINFGQGLVAIVGPNGSGKSNIADAIRWVFGEQKGRTLRTGRSEDLIYHGGNGKSQASMAEVIIRLNNSSGKIPINLEEIEITRRLYRSGESNYLLNGRKASHASVLEVLAASGFGVGSYTVIGQGMIDRLILSTGKERKELFEEASGIRQYEIKYGQTLKRIKSTSENLDEIDKLIREISPLNESLKKQSKLLNRKQKLSKTLDASRSIYIASEIKLNSGLRTEASSKLERAKKDLALLDKQIDKLEKENSSKNSDESRSDAELLNIELTKLESEKTELESALSTIYSIIEKNRALINESTQLVAINNSELVSLKNTLGTHTADQKKIEKIVAGYEKKLSNIDKKIKIQTSSLDSIRRKLGKTQKIEYLSHSLGLIDIIQDGIRKDKSEEDLNIVFYKLRRMLKHAMVDNSTELMLEASKIQNAITRLLDERENISESQTYEVIKLRAIEMDTSNIDMRMNELRANIALQDNKNTNLSAHVKIKNNEIIAKDMELKKIKINNLITQKRADLVSSAQAGSIADAEIYYSNHEKLSNKRVAIAAEINSLRAALAELELSAEQTSQTKSLWFPYAMPKVTSSKVITASDISRLEAEMDLLEEINPEIANELKNSDIRINYLRDQSSDLAKAIHNLEKVAKDTEQKIKVVFDKSFETINQNFASNFKMLFGGGDAELKLSRSSDDYGVEIIVNLPNKNAQNIASLSGGEKALASVALLSGILISNPSPFVVLDEVDAALDEENTKRFAKIISKITQHSQVLVVTHNHDTMAVADELLGVTTSGNNESSIIRVELGSFPLEAKT